MAASTNQKPKQVGFSVLCLYPPLLLAVRNMDIVRGLKAGGAWKMTGTMLRRVSRACALGAFREG